MWAFFWPNILQLIDFSKIYQLKGLKLHKKGRMNFYEHCVLTEKKNILDTLHMHQIYRG